MECACVMGIKVGRKMGGQMNNDKAFNCTYGYRGVNRGQRVPKSWYAIKK